MTRFPDRHLPLPAVERSGDGQRLPVGRPRKGEFVNGLLSLSRIIDDINERVGKTTMWLILIVVAISAGNAVVRYLLNESSNALLEIQWYLFSAVFLLMAGYVFKRNEHIRIDVVTGRMSARAQNWIDVFGIIFFLLPMVILTMTLSWPVFMNAWVSNETSPNPGGLVRWPVRLLMPIGFFLLLLQGISELIKRFAFLTGKGPNPLDKAKGPTPEELLAAEIKRQREIDEAAAVAGNDLTADRGPQGGRK
jgi:TRAP-type mannitol/chloroaromatic compound transport system permease small subunit